MAVIRIHARHTAREGIIGVVSTNKQDAPIYADRATGQVFTDATAMVNAYIQRFAERSGHTISQLDENGYTQMRKGSASIGLNVLDDHGEHHTIQIPA